VNLRVLLARERALQKLFDRAFGFVEGSGLYEVPRAPDTILVAPSRSFVAEPLESLDLAVRPSRRS